MYRKVKSIFCQSFVVLPYAIREFPDGIGIALPILLLPIVYGF